MYTLRHFLFYMGMAATAGALVGTLSSVMDWSIGLIYGVGLSAGAAIGILALREGLLATSKDSRESQHHRAA